MSTPWRSTGPRRDLFLVVLGFVLGAGVASGAFLVADDDAGGSDPPEASGGGETETTVSTVDPADTDFGELTEESEASGVRVRWTAELLEGDDAATVDFVTAHRDGTFVLVHDDTRIVEEGDRVLVCDASCAESSPEEAASRLPGTLRPFYRVLRISVEASEAPEYRITAETELSNGIFQRCGSYEPSVFGLDLPGEVQRVTQCLDAERGVPLVIDIVGEQRSVGTASLTAIADAEAADFETS